MISSSTLPVPAGGIAASADVVAAGLPIPPIERIRIFSAGQWEDFVLEWADSLRDQYSIVERCGGAGDMGRDIIAFDKTSPAIWDNFQCKHYKTGLTPGDIWVELGKLVYYTYTKEYTYPRKYVFVAPQGAGTKLSNLLRKADKLKAQLIDNWEKHCKTGITSTAEVELNADLRTYLDALDFSIFEAVPPLRIIDQHAKTRWYATRFGGGLPVRPKVAPPPLAVAAYEVISETSPILTGQYTTATAESAVFRLLLTGVDDGSLISSEDPKVAKGRQAGKVEMLELLLNQTKGRIAELQLPGDVKVWHDQLTQVESLYDAAQKELEVEQQNAASLEGKRRVELNGLRQLESRSGVLRELQRRFTLLEQQYMSDLRRLESIAEAGSRLGQMNEERCPVCGAPAEHQEHEHQRADAVLEDVAQSCLAEAVKIRALISDLHLTREDNDKEVVRLHDQCELAKTRVREVAAELTELLKPRVEIALLRLRESQATRDTYRRALEFTGRVNELQGLMAELGSVASTKGPELASAQVRSDEAEGFNKEVESLLRAWHFPGLDRVTFSEGDQDIVISGRKRASHGKGVRAIAHAAFNLALLKSCLTREMPHPGFVLIDSPLVVYREPDTDEGGFSHDVKDAFYRSIAEDFRAAQVIIFENEDPPSDLGSDANVIRFTGATHGRQGFIPKSISISDGK